ncbi:MAG: hypothetical protein K8I00_01180 [Candidatus Omnitrophica bacterium]|nr:hypothetical protein [Candidatus Omnitrophota bacterium]
MRSSGFTDIKPLDIYGEGEDEASGPDARARVQRGALNASRSNKDKLLEMIDLANIDYRVLLCHADERAKTVIRTMN